MERAIDKNEADGIAKFYRTFIFLWAEKQKDAPQNESHLL